MIITGRAQAGNCAGQSRGRDSRHAQAAKVSGAYRRLRQTLMKVLDMIRCSHARPGWLGGPPWPPRLLPGQSRPDADMAFANVSCTRSSASAVLHVSRNAAGYNAVAKTAAELGQPGIGAVTVRG